MKHLITFLLLMPVIATYAEPLPLPPDSVIYLPAVSTTANDRHGLAWSYGSLDMDAWSKYNISWYYHWSSKPWAHVPQSVEFVPMVWCDDAELWDMAVANIPADWDGYILLANEPEFPDQCNATPERVAELVHRARLMWPDAKLVAPQSHVCWWENDPPTPPCGLYGERFTVESFILAYRDKYGTIPPLHAYGLHYGDVMYWTPRLSALLDSYGIDAPVWYSEFNYCGDDAARFRAILQFLNGHPRVERYAYWSNMRADNLCALTDNNSRYPYDATWRGRVYAEFGQ